MGFNLPGKSVHSGTSGHRSALKMKQEQDAALKMMAEQGGGAKPGSSPAKAGPLLPILYNAGRMAVTRVAPQIIKQAPKVLRQTKNKIITLPSKVSPTFGSTVKNLWNKTPGWVKATGAYLGIDAGINALTGSGDDNKSNNTDKSMNKTVTPKKNSGPSPYSKAKKHGSTLGYDLDALVKQRKTVKKGSDEYNAIQNKINLSYGDKTRHGVTSSSTTKRRKTTSTMNVPGISNTETVTRKRRSGDVKSTKTTDINTGTTTKRKYTKKGDTKKIVTKKDGKRTVTKRNRKGDVVTKTRKTLNPFD